jgi:hypothetical protein
MAYATPGTVATGDVVTASAWNVLVGNDIELNTAIGVIATKNATQAIPAATSTVVTFPGTDEYDSNSFHDPASNSSRITIPTGYGGLYLVNAKVDFAAGTTPGLSGIGLLKNGVTSLGTLIEATVAADFGLAASQVILLAAGDYIELRVNCTVASTLQSSAIDTRPCIFSAFRLGSS